MARGDDALARRAAREARRAAMRARNGQEGDTPADGEPDAGADPIRAAREAATAAAVGAAVGAMRALTSRRRDDDNEEDELEQPVAEADDQPEEEEEAVAEDDEDEETREPQPSARRSGARRREGTKLGDVDRAVRAARDQLRQLHGADAESVSGFERLDDGWRVTLEVVELRRIPETTDVMASYAVELDQNGDLVTYERVRRYQRSEALDGSGA